MVDLLALRCFATVAEELHFGRAARRLGYTTSNVSQRVRDLERHLGVGLFTRTSRAVRLTAAGAELVRLADEALAAVARFEERARELAREREVRLGVAYCAYSAPVARQLVTQLRQRCPQAQIETVLLPGTLEVLEAVDAGRADVGVATWHAKRLCEQLLAPRFEFSLLVPEGHRLHDRESVTYADLDGETMLTLERDQNPELHDLIVRFFQDLGVHPRLVPRRVTTPAVAIDFVATGQGLAMSVPSMAPAPPGMRYVPVVGPTPPGRSMYLVWAPECRASLLCEIRAVAATLPDSIVSDPLPATAAT